MKAVFVFLSFIFLFVTSPFAIAECPYNDKYPQYVNHIASEALFGQDINTPTYGARVAKLTDHRYSDNKYFGKVSLTYFSGLATKAQTQSETLNTPFVFRVYHDLQDFDNVYADFEVMLGTPSLSNIKIYDYNTEFDRWPVKVTFDLSSWKEEANEGLFVELSPMINYNNQLFLMPVMNQAPTLGYVDDSIFASFTGLFTDHPVGLPWTGGTSFPSMICKKNTTISLGGLPRMKAYP